jgi:hypothetical protein
MGGQEHWAMSCLGGTARQGLQHDVQIFEKLDCDAGMWVFRRGGVLLPASLMLRVIIALRRLLQGNS